MTTTLESRSDTSSPRQFGKIFADVGAALVAYFGLRLFGADEYVAMLAATAIAAARLVFVAVRERSVDVFAGFLLAVFGVGLTFTLVTHDAHLALLAQPAGTAAAGAMFLGSLVVGRPLTFAAMRRAAAASERAGIDAMWRDNDTFRRTHTQLSGVWGVGLLVEAAARVPLALTMSVDSATVASTVVEVAAIVVLVMITRRIVKRARAAEIEGQYAE